MLNPQTLIKGQPKASGGDDKKVVEAFYAATEASKPVTSSPYLTDDIALIGWAEGANGPLEILKGVERVTWL
jgi:hypothetical protein